MTLGVLAEVLFEFFLLEMLLEFLLEFSFVFLFGWKVLPLKTFESEDGVNSEDMDSLKNSWTSKLVAVLMDCKKYF